MADSSEQGSERSNETKMEISNGTVEENNIEKINENRKSHDSIADEVNKSGTVSPVKTKPKKTNRIKSPKNVTPDKNFAELSEKLPSYAQPTVSFQLRISLQQNGAFVPEDKLPVCQRYRSISPTSLNSFIKEQRSRSVENKHSQLERMIVLSQPTHRRSKFTSIPASASNHTSASDGSSPFHSRSKSRPKKSLDDSVIDKKTKSNKEEQAKGSLPGGKLKQKTNSLDVLATKNEQRPSRPSSSPQQPRTSPSKTPFSKCSQSRDFSTHKPKTKKKKVPTATLR